MTARAPRVASRPGHAAGSIKFPPKPRTFDSPVSWLLGASLLRQLGWIGLYSMLGRRLGGLDWMSCAPLREDSPDGETLWFDYLADSGDSQKATYSVAYLCFSDLFVAHGVAGEPVHFEKAPGTTRLPRGQFLFIGGDTAYHVANQRTLIERFRNPFCWAYADLAALGRESVSRRARLYAIPGNHDYYDSLRGFNRQFRRPMMDGAPLGIPTFDRAQDASYVALRLPFGWWFFGLDTQEGTIDFRQRAFFRELVREEAPRKLIVATPEPTTVLGLRASRDATIVKTQREIGLERPFLQVEPHLEKVCCRLDLSGDVHQYARYWGPPSSPSYASVVSGLGGAFLHPTHTDFGQIPAQAKYPDAETSRREINRKLFYPPSIFWGGNIPILGFLLGAILFTAWRNAGFAELVRGEIGSLNAGLLAILPGPVSALVAVLLLRRYAARIDLANTTPSLDEVPRPVLAYALLPFVATAPLFCRLLGVQEQISGLAHSALLFFFALVGLGAVGTAVWHRGLLDERAKHSETRWWDDLLSLYIAVCGFAAIIGSFWSHGSLSATTVALHTTFLIIALVTTAGPVLNAVLVGAARRPLRVKVGFGLLGLWHSALQLMIPALWARHGLSLAVLGYAPLVLVANALGYALATREAVKSRSWALVALWLLVGAIGLWLPLRFAVTAPLEGGTAVLHGIGVAVLTALLSSVWFGWYLAVSLGFNGHNNEAGSAARIEDYKQILRIRVTKDALTAYVIAIDRVEGDGEALRPRLVDVFELRAGDAPPPAAG